MVEEVKKTDSGIPIKKVFSGQYLKKYKSNKEKPGRYPYTRGLYPSMYREKLWTMRQSPSGFGSAEETNRRFKFLLDHGQTGLSLAFRSSSQTGRNSDDPYSEGEVGRTGRANTFDK